MYFCVDVSLWRFPLWPRFQPLNTKTPFLGIMDHFQPLGKPVSVRRKVTQSVGWTLLYSIYFGLEQTDRMDILCRYSHGPKKMNLTRDCSLLKYTCMCDQQWREHWVHFPYQGQFKAPNGHSGNKACCCLSVNTDRLYPQYAWIYGCSADWKHTATPRSIVLQPPPARYSRDETSWFCTCSTTYITPTEGDGFYWTIPQTYYTAMYLLSPDNKALHLHFTACGRYFTQSDCVSSLVTGGGSRKTTDTLQGVCWECSSFHFACQLLETLTISFIQKYCGFSFVSVCPPSLYMSLHKVFSVAIIEYKHKVIWNEGQKPHSNHVNLNISKGTF